MSRLAADLPRTSNPRASSTIQVGAGLWSFLDPQGFADPRRLVDCLARIKALGFAGVDLGHLAAGPTPPALADRLEGLTACGLGCDLDPAPAPADDPLGRALKLAEALGVRAIRVRFRPGADSQASRTERDELRLMAECFRVAARRAGDAGRRLAWSFGESAPAIRPGQVIEVLERVDRPNFGVLVDTEDLRPEMPLDPLLGWVAAISVSAPADPARVEALIPGLVDSGMPGGWWTLNILAGRGDAWAVASQAGAMLEDSLRRHSA